MRAAGEVLKLVTVLVIGSCRIGCKLMMKIMLKVMLRANQNPTDCKQNMRATAFVTKLDPSHYGMKKLDAVTHPLLMIFRQIPLVYFRCTGHVRMCLEMVRAARVR